MFGQRIYLFILHLNFARRKITSAERRESYLLLLRSRPLVGERAFRLCLPTLIDGIARHQLRNLHNRTEQILRRTELFQNRGGHSIVGQLQ